MAIEHHGQSKELTWTLHVTNIVFFIIFIVEMAMKLLVLSGAYFWDPNNVFDFVIVISSVWEVIAKADSRLSVLLRFVRLVNFLPHLKRQLLVLKRTIQKAAMLCGLLLIDMMVFRHILTQEDWNLVLYNGMSATSPWAVLYFVGLIVLERNIILNILMGIVVESFQERRLQRQKTMRKMTPIGRDCRSTEFNIEEETDTKIFEPDTESAKSMKTGHSTYCLHRTGCCVRHMISHSMFDHMILVFILLNCVTIAMERPGIAPESWERWIIDMSSYGFSTIFLTEMLFKVLALGLVFGKESYCCSAWNVVDGLLVVLSLVDVLVSLVSSGKNKKLGILKVLRLLRPLSFVLLDMFIGVMVETFQQCQWEQKPKDELLREEEGDETQVECGEPEQPDYTHYSPMRWSIYDLCVSDFLDCFTTAIVFISVLMMAFEHYNQPEYIDKLVEYSCYVFIAVLIMEIVLKLVAFGVLRFFKSSSIISIIVDKTIAKVFLINPSILRVESTPTSTSAEEY
ncbi:Voltage-dependent T-type calcium channel subunit alpha-1H [Larimichthys crocea]|uniref:Voltage-dependent T-type calcium channel subunit alpha-1H n=1 Tax=Larimichthys crocea TaxID=215358 RepID=A0A6G0IEB3_LARCR|nr:Voltage-dependent T-type calcium channel subunit alpha-1H [Larimichthys crocea]